MTFTPFVIAWACLAVVVIGLAIFRNLTALHEDDNLHLSASEQKLIPAQMAIFKQLDKIDRWGKTLTVITVAMGLVLASIYICDSIIQHSKQLVG
jgi:hypothetical protein